MSVSCLLSLVTSKRLGDLIGHQGLMLQRHAARKGFLNLWNYRSMRRLALFNMLWIYTAAAQSVRMYMSGDSILLYERCVLLVVILQAGLYFAALHCAFHMTGFLELILDEWTVRFNKTHDCVNGAESWNVIEALMQRVARSIETTFLAVQAYALIAMICCVARVLDIITAKPSDDTQTWWMLTLLELLPTGITAGCALALFAKATAITEQGFRVPPVVNSLLVRPKTAITSEHQRFVNFLKNSKVGCYWKGCRLDATVFVNYCYLCGAVICALFTTALKFKSM